MPRRTVSATTLSRNFSDFLNQVRYQGVTLEIKRGNEVVACVSSPALTVGYPIAHLDRLLDSLPRLSDAESGAFLNDIHEGLAALAPEPDAWGS